MQWAAIIKPLNNNLGLNSVACSIALTSSKRSRSLTPCSEPQLGTGTAIPSLSTMIKCPSLCLHQAPPHLQYSVCTIYSPLKDWKTYPFGSLDPYDNLHHMQNPQLLCLSTATMFRPSFTDSSYAFSGKKKCLMIRYQVLK